MPKKEIKESLDVVSEVEVKEEIAVTEPVEVETPESSVETIGEINVADPLVLRPRELPLVVTPAGGSWKNEAQAEYAKIVNAYAYKNPKKWNAVIAKEGLLSGKSKKDILIARLAEIGNDPEMLNKYSPQDANTKFSNKLMQ